MSRYLEREPSPHYSSFSSADVLSSSSSHTGSYGNNHSSDELELCSSSSSSSSNNPSCDESSSDEQQHQQHGLDPDDRLVVHPPSSSSSCSSSKIIHVLLRQPQLQVDEIEEIKTAEITAVSEIRESPNLLRCSKGDDGSGCQRSHKVLPGSRVVAGAPPTPVPRVHQCHYINCSKNYTKTSHLKAHLRTHTGINRYC